MQSEITQECLLKFVLVGKSGVGKTSILTRLVSDLFQPYHPATIGINFEIKMLPIDGRIVKLQVWDDVSRSLKAVMPDSYRHAHCIVLVCDITDRQSFLDIDGDWLKKVRQCKEIGKLVCLLGNKSDKTGARVVSNSELEIIATQLGIPRYNTSALTGDGIYEVFIQMTREVLKQNRQEIGKRESILLKGRPQRQNSASRKCW